MGVHVDRRYGHRVPLSDRVELRWLDSTGPQHSTLRLADVSVWGAAIRAERPVFVGTPVSLRYQDKVLTGKVKHCARERDHFLLGIEFEDECKWPLPVKL